MTKMIIILFCISLQSCSSNCRQVRKDSDGNKMVLYHEESRINSDGQEYPLCYYRRVGS